MLITRLYTVQLNPKAERPYESAVFIADGFNVWAFAFGGFWALYHRLWIAAIALFCITEGLTYLGRSLHIGHVGGIVLQLGAQAMIGFVANDLRRYGLEKRGWVTSDVVIAPNLLEAERRYYDRYLGQIERSPGSLPLSA